MSEPTDKKNQIVQAAKPLFAQFGVKKTTIDEIAQAARVAKGTIYLYFKSKEELLAAVLEDIANELEGILTKAVDGESTTHNKLLAFFLEHRRFSENLIQIHKATNEARVEIMSYAHLDQTVFDGAMKFIQNEKKIVERVLRAGVKSGELEIDDMPVVVSAITATLHVMSEPWHLGELISVEQKAGVMIDLIINGIRKR